MDRQRRPALANRLALALPLIVAAGLLIAFGKREVVRTALPWCIFSCGALTGLLVMAVFVFHIDAFGWNRRGATYVLRERLAPGEPNETVLVEETGACGAFNAIRRVYHSILQVTLTNRRLVIRFVTSYRGLCLKCVPLDEIARVATVEGFHLTRFKAAVVYFKGDGQPKFFTLISRKLEAWMDAFGRAGVVVADNLG